MSTQRSGTRRRRLGGSRTGKWSGSRGNNWQLPKCMTSKWGRCIDWAFSIIRSMKMIRSKLRIVYLTLTPNWESFCCNSQASLRPSPSWRWASCATRLAEFRYLWSSSIRDWRTKTARWTISTASTSDASSFPAGRILESPMVRTWWKDSSTGCAETLKKRLSWGNMWCLR